MLWKFPLLSQYSAISSVVFERNCILVVKYNHSFFLMYHLVM